LDRKIRHHDANSKEVKQAVEHSLHWFSEALPSCGPAEERNTQEGIRRGCVLL